MTQETQSLVAGRYALQELVGSGGMGRVWRAQDTLLNRAVAVKEIQVRGTGAEIEQLRERVLREARAGASFNAPGAVQIFDVIDEEDRAFIVMELAEAPTLDDVVRERGPLELAEAARVGRELTAALAVAHDHGVVHRDVKPANVLCCDDGRIKLTDFGIASITGDPTLTESGLIFGSPAYMAPEQARNHGATPASDVYSVAATMYFALEGHPPFDRGNPIATLTAVVHEPPPPLLRAGSLGAILLAALAKEPADRPTLEQLSLHLAMAPPAATSGPDPTVALPAQPAVTREPRRLRLSLSVALVLVLVAGALAGTWLWRRGGPTAQSAASRHAGLPAPTAPPAGWDSYTDNATGYVVRFPAGWESFGVDRDTREFRDAAASSRYLRVSVLRAAGRDPLATVTSVATTFARNGDHPNYRQLRLSRLTWAGNAAALWEYRWGNTDLHAVWLEVQQGGTAYVLNFQTQETRWAADATLLAGFEGGFTPPRS